MSRTEVGGLEAARREIDQLDAQLLTVLARRMRVVDEVGRLKTDHAGEPLLDPERERQLLASWSEKAQKVGVSGYFARRVLREVLSHSRRFQEGHADRSATSAEPRSVRVAYQGEPWCYSDLAASKLFETRAGAERIAYRTFAAAIEALRAGHVDYALMPVENSVVGGIGELNKLLLETDLYVVDEEVWDVEHVLAVPAGSEGEQVTHVRSHPVALAQCGAFLARLPEARAEPWFDTAGAAASLRSEPRRGAAAICSQEAADAHGLVVVQHGIADRDNNVTRFLLLAREAETPSRGVPAKTSMLLTLDHQQGALAHCLAVFAAESINLTRIESRPQPQTPWQYSFFIDIEGNQADARVRRALDLVRGQCHLLRVLGSYPMRTKENQHLSGAPLRTPVAPVATRGEPLSSAASCGRDDSTSDTPRAVRERTVVRAGGTLVGGSRFTLILGPCAVESREQILEAAEMVKVRGASMLRGGAFKPRTSPYSFQGLGATGLDYLHEAGRTVDLPVVTEVMRIEDLASVVDKADVVQVGARNMQNFALLRELGRVDRPVLLKRGLSATVKELLMAAEYVMAGGNQRVILCERGIRTFETSTRSTLDIAAIPVLKERTHLPVIVDPSHAAGVRHLVVPLALAAAAAGADGLIVEAHPNPDEALCDKDQALRAEDVDELVRGLIPILESQGRSL